LNGDEKMEQKEIENLMFECVKRETAKVNIPKTDVFGLEWI